MAETCSLTSCKQPSSLAPRTCGASRLANVMTLHCGNGCSFVVKAALLPGCKDITLSSSYHATMGSSESGVESASPCTRPSALRQRAGFRVSAVAARSQSPTLSRPKQSTEEYIVWDAPRDSRRALTLEEEASTSGEGLWEKPDRGAKARHWLVEESERKATDDRGFWTKEGEEAGPLPWYSRERVLDELFEPSVAGEWFNAVHFA